MTVLSKFAEPAHIEPFNNYYFYRSCWKNALYNLMTSPEHEPTPTSRRKFLVAGSFETADGWGIWGTQGKKDPNFFFEDWCQSHVWIEDEDGRIWDHLSEEYNDHIDKLVPHMLKHKLNNGKTVAVRIPMGGIDINGMTNAEIEATYGFRYIPAPEVCQGHILSHTQQKWLPYKPYNFWTGKQYSEGWIGLGYKADTIRQQIGKNAVFYSINKLAPAICEGDKEAQLWWRAFWQQPVDTERFDYYIAEMGEETLTRRSSPQLVAEATEWIKTGKAAPSLKAWMSEVIDAVRADPEDDLTSALASITEGFTRKGLPVAGKSFTFGNIRAEVITSTAV
jgi:hypothetical protein